MRLPWLGNSGDLCYGQYEWTSIENRRTRPLSTLPVVVATRGRSFVSLCRAENFGDNFWSTEAMSRLRASAAILRASTTRPAVARASSDRFNRALP